MKTIIVNGSPRKNWNTAQILQEAQKGAESVGAEVEYFDLYDLDFSGCRSCLACKKTGIGEPCKCFWKDGLTPVLEKIFQADRLIIGTPIYFGQPTGEVRCFMERLIFPLFSYNVFTHIYQGKIDVDIFVTMGAPMELYQQSFGKALPEYFGILHALNGNVRIIPICDTLQVSDYSKYEMKGFSEEHKKSVHETQFKADLQNAYKIGAGD